MEKPSTLKKGYTLPRAPMTNSDLTRLINSDEIQSIVRPPKVQKRGRPLKKNPLKNLGALLKLNPYAKTARRQQLLSQVCYPKRLLPGLFLTDEFDDNLYPRSRIHTQGNAVCGKFTWSKTQGTLALSG